MSALPGEPCERCGSAERGAMGVTASPGLTNLGRLYLDLMTGAGPDLDPSSRAELHRRAMSSRSSENQTTDYINAFVASFKRGSVEELEPLLGVQVTPRSVRSALEGGINSCPWVVHLALAAFAIQIDAPDDQQRLAGQEPFVEDRSDHTSHPENLDDLTQRILAVARQAGFPAEAILQRMAGSSMQQLERGGITTVHMWKRFVQDLPMELREHLPRQAQRSEWPERLKLTPLSSFDEIRSVHRERIESILRDETGGREKWSRRCSTSYKWCLKNDTEWLDQASPIRPCLVREALSFEESRRVHRERIEQFVGGNAVGRKMISDRCSSSYKWCLKNDNDWLNQTCPVRPPGRPKRFAA